VRRGDSLWVISRRFGVSVNKLARWNGLAKSSVLRPGKRLVIWRGKAPAQATARATATKVAARPAALPATGSVHVVRRGENLWSIARRYRVSSRQLAKWNGIEAGELLQPGQTLNLAPPQGASGAAPATPGAAAADAGSI